MRIVRNTVELKTAVAILYSYILSEIRVSQQRFSIYTAMHEVESYRKSLATASIQGRKVPLPQHC